MLLTKQSFQMENLWAGKRLMTPEERTVGPPQATSSLLGRLQRGQDQQQPGVSQRLPQQASAEPAQPFFQQQVQPEGLQGAHDAQPAQAPRATGQAHPVVVTPFNPQVSGKQKVAAGQQADAGMPLQPPAVFSPSCAAPPGSSFPRDLPN